MDRDEVFGLRWSDYTEVQGPAGLSTEEVLVRVRDDCGGPHVWEKFSVMDNQCGCSHCGTERWYWMECANCMATWSVDVMTEETRAIFEAAPWG